MLTSFIIQDGDTALHGAASRGHTKVVRLLIQSGATLDALNKVYIQH